MAAILCDSIVLVLVLVCMPLRVLLFSNTEIFLSLFRHWYHQRIDMNDILQKSDVKSRRQDQTQLDTVSEGKKKMSQSQDTSRCLFQVQFKRSC